MATFGALKTKLRDFLAADTGRISDSVCGDLVNMAQRELLRKYDLRFGEATEDIAVLAGVRDYDPPAGFSRPHTLWYLATDSIAYLKYKSREELDYFFPDTTVEGDPSVYTVWGNVLRVAATPKQDLTLSFNFYRLLPDFTDDADENAFTINAWEPILFRALSEATKYLIEDPRAGLWDEKARATEIHLVMEHSRARHAGRKLQIEEP